MQKKATTKVTPKPLEETLTPKPSNDAPTIVFVKPHRPVNRVFVHCSASDNPEHDDVSVIREWHRERHFNDVGYHYFITSAGILQEGRSLEEVPAAQAPHNKGTIAICLHGLTKEKFTEAQFDTLRELCTQIKGAYGGQVTFHGHREVAAKECPVFDYKTVLNLDTVGRMN